MGYFLLPHSTLCSRMCGTPRLLATGVLQGTRHAPREHREVRAEVGHRSLKGLLDATAQPAHFAILLRPLLPARPEARGAGELT